MVKKLISFMLALLMVLSMAVMVSAEEMKIFGIKDITENAEGLKVVGEYFYVKKEMDYFGIKNVDLSGVKSIGLTGTSTIGGGKNAENFPYKSG